MMNKILTQKYFNIYSDNNNHYIVHNTRKKFVDGHTHIDNFNTAKYILYLALYKRMPKNDHLSIYLIDSVIRLSTDTKYINQMLKFKQRMIDKKIRYRN